MKYHMEAFNKRGTVLRIEAGIPAIAERAARYILPDANGATRDVLAASLVEDIPERIRATGRAEIKTPAVTIEVRPLQ